MDIVHFQNEFENIFPKSSRNKPNPLYGFQFRIKKLDIDLRLYDPFRKVKGLLSVKKQRLLNLAYRCVNPKEAYLEVGSWMGKSLIAAMHKNAPRPTFACENFSEFNMQPSLVCENKLKENLKLYGCQAPFTFYNENFRHIFTHQKLPIAIGAYFYDAAHDEENQYLGIKLAEPFLADEALVLVDDWRFAGDSQSKAKAGTERAIRESKHHWKLLYDLPARFNGDLAMWWNGIAVYSFRL